MKLALPGFGRQLAVGDLQLPDVAGIVASATNDPADQPAMDRGPSRCVCRPVDGEDRERDRDPLEGVQRRGARAGRGEEVDRERRERPGTRRRAPGTRGTACGSRAARGSDQRDDREPDRPERERVLARLAREAPAEVGLPEDQVVDERRRGAGRPWRSPASDRARVCRPSRHHEFRRRPRTIRISGSPCHGCSGLASAPSSPAPRRSGRRCARGREPTSAHDHRAERDQAERVSPRQEAREQVAEHAEAAVDDS